VVFEWRWEKLDWKVTGFATGQRGGRQGQIVVGDDDGVV